MNAKNKLIILTGPTAVGKTELSIALAKAVNGEIVSADSIQVYRDMDIGSAKITAEEMDGVPHHLIDVLLPNEDFNVALFKEMAVEAIKGIYERGKIPVIVGGTGFYIQALLNDIEFPEVEDDGYREGLERLFAEKGAEYLYEMLRAVDPDSLSVIHANNTKRVIRALEFYHQTGTPISKHNEEERKKESPYSFAYFVLTNKREYLYDRIEKRVDLMLQNGLVAEVQGLISKYQLTNQNISMQGLGYKEILAYLNGEISLDEAIYILKRDTRHFAKRQLTWFKREREVIWIDKSEYQADSEVLEFMLAELKTKNII